MALAIARCTHAKKVWYKSFENWEEFQERVGLAEILHDRRGLKRVFCGILHEIIHQF